MLKELINPDATNTTYLFKIPKERLTEMQEQLHALSDAIGADYKNYYIKEDGINILLMGKIVERMLLIANNIQEQFFLCFCINVFLENTKEAMIDHNTNDNFAENILQKLKK